MAEVLRDRDCRELLPKPETQKAPAGVICREGISRACETGGVEISPKAFERALKRLCLVDAVVDYRAEEDKLDDFLKECTCDLPGASVAHSVVFESYRAWAVMNGLRYRPTPRMLARRLRAHGWREEKDSEGNSRWIGFSLSLVD